MLDAKELFRNTQLFADQLSYRPRKPVTAKVEREYSAKAERISKFILRAGNGRGGEGFGCRTETIHRLVELIMDEPIPPLEKSKAKKRGENWILNDLDEMEFECPLALVRVHNLHGGTFPEGVPFQIFESTYYEETSFTLFRDPDGVEHHATLYLEECRPATYEECRLIAWRSQRLEAPPADFQPETGLQLVQASGYALDRKTG